MLDQHAVLEHAHLGVLGGLPHHHGPVHALAAGEELGLGEHRAATPGLAALATALLLGGQPGGPLDPRHLVGGVRSAALVLGTAALSARAVAPPAGALARAARPPALLGVVVPGVRGPVAGPVLGLVVVLGALRRAPPTTLAALGALIGLPAAAATPAATRAAPTALLGVVIVVTALRPTVILLVLVVPVVAAKVLTPCGTPAPRTGRVVVPVIAALVVALAAGAPALTAGPGTALGALAPTGRLVRVTRVTPRVGVVPVLLDRSVLVLAGPSATGVPAALLAAPLRAAGVLCVTT